MPTLGTVIPAAQIVTLEQGFLNWMYQKPLQVRMVAYCNSMRPLRVWRMVIFLVFLPVAPISGFLAME